MAATTESKKTIQFVDIAAMALGAPLEGGTFAGIITPKNGAHVAVVLLADKPVKSMKWADAKAWAESVDGVLPTRPVAAMLFANAKDQFEAEWHWTSEAYSGSGAWIQGFVGGTQITDRVDDDYCARAVRMIPLVP
jgi:hypothetical protein